MANETRDNPPQRLWVLHRLQEASAKLASEKPSKAYKPKEIKLEVPSDATPGQTLHIAGTTGLVGKGVLELVCRRDMFKTAPPARERFDPTDKGLAALHDVYVTANDRCWARWGLDLPGGQFATEVEIPPECRGPCHVRLLVADGKSHGLGAANIYIRSQPVRHASKTAEVGK